MELWELSALELGARIQRKEVGVKEAVLAAIERATAQDKNCNAFITLCAETALDKAEQIQSGIDNGTFRGPLAGVPVAVKDNICTVEVRTTCGSKMLQNFVPDYQATVMDRLEAEGAILFGKLNMDEFGMGSTSETSFFGPVKNPLDCSRVPGGSSGGSAASVAAGEAWYTLGSDTGGSIRQPCSFTGTVGIKPTYGRVSRYGLVAYASSMDQIGPIASNVSDCAAVLNIISGYDPKDSTSVRRPEEDFTRGLVCDVRDLRIGVPKEYLQQGIQEEVRRAIRKAADLYADMGAEVEECSIAMTEYAVPAYYILASAEASSNLSRYDGIRYGHRTGRDSDLDTLYYQSRTEGFGLEAKRRILLGNFALSAGYYEAYYQKATQVRALIRKNFLRLFQKYDLLLSPAAPATAMKLGESLTNPLKMYLGDVCTVALNLAGLPGMVLPSGTDAKGLPIGLQLMGNAFSEKTLIRAGYSFEQWSVHKEPAGKKEANG